MIEQLTPIGTLLLILYVLIKDLVIPMWSKIKDLRLRGANVRNDTYPWNPHPPGEAQTCLSHTAELIGIKRDIENIKDSIRDLKNKIK